MGKSDESFDFVKSDAVLRQLMETNYLIEYDENVLENSCCIYFSSHGIYYPETQQVFLSKIVEKNVYEWYRRRIPGVKKHIFLRDIRKQFYVEGINNVLNSIDKLVEWLKRETQNYSVITAGSSAGGMQQRLSGHCLGQRKYTVFPPSFHYMMIFRIRRGNYFLNMKMMLSTVSIITYHHISKNINQT